MLDSAIKDQIVGPTFILLDSEPMINAEDHIGIVRMVAKRHWHSKPGEVLEDSEIYSDAMLGLCKAIQTYHSSNGSFANWAVAVIENTLISLLRQKNRKFRKLVEFVADYDPVIETTNELPIELLDELLAVVPDESQPFLSERYQDNISLLKKYYLEKKSVGDLADEFQISRQSVYNRLEKVINQIREKHKSLIEDWQ